MAGMGAPGGLVCATCHHGANFDPAGVPADPGWALAPAGMAWQGKTLEQMCAPDQGARPATAAGTWPRLIKHMAEDELVGWGLERWEQGRIPAPGTQHAVR